MTERFKKLVSSIDYYDIWDTVEDKGHVAEDLANALYEENEQLKSFIKKLTNRNGEILLMNGYGYTKLYVEKLLNEKELEE